MLDRTCIVGYGIDTVYCWKKLNEEKCKSFLEYINNSPDKKSCILNDNYENIEECYYDAGTARIFWECDKSGQLSYARTDASEYLFLEALLPWEIGSNKDYCELTIENVQDIIVSAIQTLTDMTREEIISLCKPINDIEDY